jgi:hypothetical protein
MKLGARPITATTGRALALLGALTTVGCAATVSFDDYGTEAKPKGAKVLFAVRGNITGLGETRATLYLGNLSLDVGDGPFAFPPVIANGIHWVVTVEPPATRACFVLGNEGTIAGADAAAVSITCVAKGAPK